MGKIRLLLIYNNKMDAVPLPRLFLIQCADRVQSQFLAVIGWVWGMTGAIRFWYCCTFLTVWKSNTFFPSAPSDSILGRRMVLLLGSATINPWGQFIRYAYPLMHYLITREQVL